MKNYFLFLVCFFSTVTLFSQSAFNTPERLANGINEFGDMALSNSLYFEDLNNDGIDEQIFIINKYPDNSLGNNSLQLYQSTSILNLQRYIGVKIGGNQDNLDNSDIQFLSILPIDTAKIIHTVIFKDINNDSKKDIGLIMADRNVNYTSLENDNDLLWFTAKTSNTFEFEFFIEHALTQINFPLRNGEKANFLDINIDGEKELIFTNSSPLVTCLPFPFPTNCFEKGTWIYEIGNNGIPILKSNFSDNLRSQFYNFLGDNGLELITTNQQGKIEISQLNNNFERTDTLLIDVIVGTTLTNYIAGNFYGDEKLDFIIYGFEQLGFGYIAFEQIETNGSISFILKESETLTDSKIISPTLLESQDNNYDKIIFLEKADSTTETFLKEKVFSGNNSTDNIITFDCICNIEFANGIIDLYNKAETSMSVFNDANNISSEFLLNLNACGIYKFDVVNNALTNPTSYLQNSFGYKNIIPLPEFSGIDNFPSFLVSNISSNTDHFGTDIYSAIDLFQFNPNSNNSLKKSFFNSISLIADLNNDGVSDQILGNDIIRLSQSNGGFQEFFVNGLSAFGSKINAVDMNGDGFLDLALLRNNGVGYLPNDGNGGFSSNSYIPVLPLPNNFINFSQSQTSFFLEGFNLLVDDFNSDNQLDIVFSYIEALNPNTPNFQLVQNNLLYINTGNGYSFEANFSDNVSNYFNQEYNAIRTVKLAFLDVNNDGNKDFISSTLFYDSFSETNPFEAKLLGHSLNFWIYDLATDDFELTRKQFTGVDTSIYTTSEISFDKLDFKFTVGKIDNDDYPDIAIIQNNNEITKLEFDETSNAITEETLFTDTDQLIDVELLDMNIDGFDDLVFTRKINLYSDRSSELWWIENNNGVVSSTAENLAKTAVFDIFPNPTRDFLNIRLKDIQKTEKITVEVFDINGRQLLEQSDYESQFKLDIKSLENSLYIVTVSDSRGNLLGAKKFLKAE